MVFRLLSQKSPIKLQLWVIIRDVFNSIHHEPDSLFKEINFKISKGELLKVPELRNILHDDLLGVWSLDEESIYILWDMLLRHRPEVLIECGAGVSTMVLACYASLTPLLNSVFPRIICLEQNEDVKNSVESRLKKSDLNQYVKVLYSPIDQDGNYQISDAEMLKSLNGRLADLLLIDGPSGPPGCRATTMPLLKRYCNENAQWLLDDALRDGELKALQTWSNLQKVSVDGIYAVGKGLARGRLL